MRNLEKSRKYKKLGDGYRVSRMKSQPFFPAPIPGPCGGGHPEQRESRKEEAMVAFLLARNPGCFVPGPVLCSCWVSGTGGYFLHYRFCGSETSGPAGPKAPPPLPGRTEANSFLRRKCSVGSKRLSRKSVFSLTVSPGNDDHNLWCSIRFLAHTRGRGRAGEIHSH